MGIRDDAIQFNTKPWFRNIEYNTADFYRGNKKEPTFKGSFLVNHRISCAWKPYSDQTECHFPTRREGQ